MLNRANDKRYDFNYLNTIIRKELELIKDNWLIFAVCFLVSRYSIIGVIFPFAIIVLCTYCYVEGPSLTVLLITLFSIWTVKFDFTYSVILSAIYMFFYNFRNDSKKPVWMIALYASCVLFFSKTSILIVDGFNIDGLFLNALEAVFILSGTILVIEIVKRTKKINKTVITSFFSAKKVKIKTEKSNAEAEAASTVKHHVLNQANKAIKNFDAIQSGILSQGEADNQKKKMLNIFSDKAKARIKEQLLWENINVKFFEIIPGTANSIFLSITVRTEKTPEKAEEAIIFTIRNLCGVKLRCTEKINANPNYYVLKFKNIKRLRIRSYIASAVKDGSPVSGDSYTYTGKGDKYYAVLCDGIGSGEEAFTESNGAVDMLSRFLFTDFTEEQILKTLNSLLMLKLDKDRFVTFDMQIIDYNLKEARFYKAGTPPTFLVSGESIEKIEGRSLPMGILDNFDYDTFKKEIKRGDIIIMISDGIIDSISMDEKKSLDKYLHSISNKDPQTMADSILNYALKGQRHIIDDMTVLVTKIG